MLKKIFIGFLILSVVFIVGLVAVVINWLPNPKDLVSGKTSQSAQKVNTTKSVKNETIEDAPLEDQSKITDSKSEDKAQGVESSTATNNKNSDSLDTVMKFVEEDFKDIRVCQNLKNSQLQSDLKNENKNPKDSEDKSSIDLSKIFSDQERSNPTFEAYRTSLKYVFQDPDLKNLFYKIKELGQTPDNPEEKKSFLEKAGFYSQVTYTAAKMMFRKSDFELMNDRAIHMALLAQIVAKKPELANDSRILSFCEDLENATKSGESVDIKTERAEILKLIDYSGLTTKELDFDPNSYTKFAIKSSDQGFSFSMSDKQ